LRSQNVWNEGLRLDDVAYIKPETHQKMSGTHVRDGDLLFNITGASIGRCAIVPDSFDTGNVSQHVVIVRSISKEVLQFLHLVLISNHVQQTVMDVQVGVSREGLSIGKLGQFIIPIPPLTEQHRIVAKVDELMALCDQLETQHSNATEAHGNSSTTCSVRSRNQPFVVSLSNHTLRQAQGERNLKITGNASPRISTPYLPPKPASTPSSKPCCNWPSWANSSRKTPMTNPPANCSNAYRLKKPS